MNEMLRQYINLKSNISLVSGILSLQEALVAVKIKFQYFLFFFSLVFVVRGFFLSLLMVKLQSPFLLLFTEHGPMIDLLIKSAGLSL